MTHIATAIALLTTLIDDYDREDKAIDPKLTRGALIELRRHQHQVTEELCRPIIGQRCIIDIEGILVLGTITAYKWDHPTYKEIRVQHSVTNVKTWFEAGNVRLISPF